VAAASSAAAAIRCVFHACDPGFVIVLSWEFDAALCGSMTTIV
jgi:hypothetical protein